MYLIHGKAIVYTLTLYLYIFNYFHFDSFILINTYFAALVWPSSGEQVLVDWGSTYVCSLIIRTYVLLDLILKKNL